MMPASGPAAAEGAAARGPGAAAVPVGPSNADVADALERVAELLAASHANAHRVRAWREGARVVRSLGEPVAELLGREGRPGLEALRGIGRSLAAAIDELCHGGRLRLLERLEGQVSPEDLFTTVPGVGERLAHAIHAELGVETLEELELAAHDGRLGTVRGVGPRRVRAIRDSLDVTLARSSRRRARLLRAAERDRSPEPDVGLLLEIDETYRREAEAGRLRRIAPRRFNPQREAWLPVLHEDREGWFFTALFSNTARAHQLGMTLDWVVIFAERDGDERQWTVVTETRGPLAGRRVVRGREGECVAHHRRRGRAR